MSCPLCGDVCRCPELRPLRPAANLNSRFVPDVELGSPDHPVNSRLCDGDDSRFATGASATESRGVVTAETEIVNTQSLASPAFEGTTEWRQEVAARLSKYRQRR